jgi:hypothetical protein
MKMFWILFPVVLALLGCDNNTGQAKGASKNISLLSFEKDFDIGPGLAGRAVDPLLSKKLGTSVGGQIEIKSMYVWSFNSFEWEKGGNLHLVNEDSLGGSSRVVCSVNAATGDKFMQSKNRRTISLTGTIKSYSSSEGLFIEPCNATW